MAPLAADVLLVAAGVLAGVMGTAGAITSLVSYPALLLVGLNPFAANVGNLVALIVCAPGAALTSRRELVGVAHWLRPALPVAAAGAAVGAVLLLTTPSGVFEDIVPVLVAAGAVALLFQPRLTARRAGRPHHGRAPALAVIAVLSVYGGYFGAGGGVMLLATTLILIDTDLPRANAIKNMLVGAGGVAAALVLICATSVPWARVVPLSAGMFLGSLLGPLVARRLPATVVRWTIALLGLALALDLWLG